MFENYEKDYIMRQIKMLNERDDAYLEAHNFTRAEIEDGLKNIAQQYGVVL